MRKFLLLLISVVIVTPAALGDTIHLKNGSVLKGKVTSFADDQFIVMLDTGSGRYLSKAMVYMGDVVRIEFDSATGSGGDVSTTTSQPAESAPRIINDTPKKEEVVAKHEDPPKREEAVTKHEDPPKESPKREEPSSSKSKKQKKGSSDTSATVAHATQPEPQPKEAATDTQPTPPPVKEKEKEPEPKDAEKPTETPAVTPAADKVMSEKAPSEKPSSDSTEVEKAPKKAYVALKTMNIDVAAKKDWTSSGLIVKRGDHIRVTASGTITLDPVSGRTCGPEGISDLPDPKKLMPDQPTGALIAVISSDNDDFIFLGRSGEFTAARDGLLFLSVNEGVLADNVGSFKAVVEVLGPARK
jgi:hypothetical protein